MRDKAALQLIRTRAVRANTLPAWRTQGCADTPVVREYARANQGLRRHRPLASARHVGPALLTARQGQSLAHADRVVRTA